MAREVSFSPYKARPVGVHVADASGLVYGTDSHGNPFNPSVNAKLMDVIRTAATQFPMKVVATSGRQGRSTGTTNHPNGRAIDVQIYDQNGQPLANYAGNPFGVKTADAKAAYPIYEQFAQLARQVQQQKYPELADAFRWGGYFTGGVNPGDLMHFDVSGGLSPKTPPMDVAWEYGIGNGLTVGSAALDGLHPASSAVQAAKAAPVQATPQAVDQLARVVLAEARGEGDDGMAAVASVVKNRALTGVAGGDISAVLSQPSQFAEPLKGGFTPAEYQKARRIAEGVLDGSISDPTGGATYFANPKTSDPRALKQITNAAQPMATIGNHVFYGKPGEVPAETAAAMAQPADAAIDIGGEPAWITTVSDQPAVAAPVDQTIPAGPYGADKVVTAIQSGDAKAAQTAFDDMKSAASAAFFSGKATVADLTKGIGNYFKSQAPVLSVSFTKYPTLMKSVPADLKPAAEAAVKAAPAPVVDAAPVEYADWATPRQTDEDVAQAVFGGGPGASDLTPTGVDTPAAASPTRSVAPAETHTPYNGVRGSAGGSRFTAEREAPAAKTGIGAWGASQPSDITPFSPSTPYPKAVISADAGNGIPSSGNDLTAAPSLKAALAFAGGPLSGAPIANGFGSMATPDLLAASLVPTVAGHVSFTPPAGAKSAPKSAPVARQAMKGVTPGLASGAGFGARPPSGISAFGLPASVMSAIGAANKAGFGTTPTSMLGQLASQGYTLPNFSSGSGGATLAYNRNGGTTTDVHGNTVNVGHYVDSQGTTHSYTWSPSGAP